MKAAFEVKRAAVGFAHIGPAVSGVAGATLRTSREGAVVVEGHASLWWKRDLADDVVAKGAFAESLAARGPGAVKMLHQHDAAEPVGVWDEVREDTDGLFVRGRIITETPRGRLVGALVKAGALDGLSIGFRAKKARRDESGRLRVLSAVELWEVSLVTFPMLPGARLKWVLEQRGNER